MRTMRVTGGVLRSRSIAMPRGNIRPTQDKVRQALFSSMGDLVCSSRFLDLFAGSGAVGLEAWSRGAAHVCWVEADSRSFATLKKNVETLCLGERGASRAWPDFAAGTTSLARTDAVRFFQRVKTDAPFDIIFADPPYEGKAYSHWADRLFDALSHRPDMLGKGLFVMEHDCATVVGAHENWRLISNRAYGRTRLSIFTRGTVEPEGEHDEARRHIRGNIRSDHAGTR